MQFSEIKESFYFTCSQCGNCCTGYQKVFLDPYDLFKMARYLRFSHTRSLFEQDFVTLVQGQHRSWVPQIKFRERPFRFCPFLQNFTDEKDQLRGRCSLHGAYKPFICSLAPLGREIDFVRGQDRFLFVKPDPECPGPESSEEHRIKDIKESYSTELLYQSRFFRMLHDLDVLNYSSRKYMELLYIFPVDRSIESIYEKIEKSVENVINL